MAAVPALSSSLCSSVSHHALVPRSLCPSPPLFSLSSFPSPPRLRRIFLPPPQPLRASLRPVKAVAEGEAAAPEEEQAAEAAPAEGPTVSVPVSPSDMLIMYFQAEGTMEESALSAVNKALEGLEGISDLSVRVEEGIATVELVKETTIQATGVASNLVEIIQGAGFKLKTLNLGFQDEEDKQLLPAIYED